MKITAKVVPYSSVVGSSVTLHAESGMTICQLSLLSVIPPNFTFTPELHKQTSTRIAEWVAGALNGAAEFDAISALENSKASLADAPSNAPEYDLSSLRKGAEVAYRLLTKNDVVQAGDEVLADDTVSWLPVVGWEIGMNYSPAIFVPVRRALVSGSREDGA